MVLGISGVVWLKCSKAISGWLDGRTETPGDTILRAPAMQIKNIP